MLLFKKNKTHTHTHARFLTILQQHRFSAGRGKVGHAGSTHVPAKVPLLDPVYLIHTLHRHRGDVSSASGDTPTSVLPAPGDYGCWVSYRLAFQLCGFSHVGADNFCDVHDPGGNWWWFDGQIG